jgi:hypothetical protein
MREARVLRTLAWQRTILPLPRGGYVFSVWSAAVLGSSNVSTPKTPELYRISPALKPVAPKDVASRRAPKRGRAHQRPCCTFVEKQKL